MIWASLRLSKRPKLVTEVKEITCFIYDEFDKLILKLYNSTLFGCVLISVINILGKSFYAMVVKHMECRIIKRRNLIWPCKLSNIK